MGENFEKIADIARAHASLENMRENMEMKKLAKEILPEKNYVKFMKSYRFTFWFQLLGMIAGFLIPCTILLVIYKNFAYCLFGAVFGILFMCIWLTISMIIPQTKIYRRFAKWFRNEHSTLDELETVFHEKS